MRTWQVLGLVVLGGGLTSATCRSQGQNVILVGFPGGPVCTEKHIPGYVAMVGLPCMMLITPFVLSDSVPDKSLCFTK